MRVMWYLVLRRVSTPEEGEETDEKIPYYENRKVISQDQLDRLHDTARRNMLLQHRLTQAFEEILEQVRRDEAKNE